MRKLIAVMALSVLAANVMAAVSPEEAAKLGTSLTPVGAEKAGNADGSIPAWTGGIPKNAGAVDSKGFLHFYTSWGGDLLVTDVRLP